MSVDKRNGGERVIVVEMLGLIYQPKKNNWVAIPASVLDFSKAESSCACMGTGWVGWVNVTVSRDGVPVAAKMRVVCLKCYQKMLKPNTPPQPATIVATDKPRRVWLLVRLVYFLGAIVGFILWLVRRVRGRITTKGGK